jgi:hypothetical protein
VNLDKLITQLLTSGLQQKDPPLYQVINELIKSLRSVYNQLQTGELGGVNSFPDETYLTSGTPLPNLPNGRQLIAGTNITLDDSVPNELEISANAAPSVTWSVLTNGDPTSPEIIFDAFGDVIMVHIP